MISFGVFETFGAGLLILGFGYLLSKLRIFSVLCLPAAVLGGVFALSVLVLFSYFFELKISFDESPKESLLLAFFASLGLGIDFSKKSNFSKNFFIFLGLCAFIMVLQNLLGITIISLFDKQKELGLIAGSISLSGSFGMGAFWSEVLKTEPYNITNALDISIACATFGVLFGSVLGAPLGAFLIEKFVLKKENSRFESKEKSPSQKELGKENNLNNALVLFFSKKELKNTIISVLLLAFCVLCASAIKLFISLPAIIFALIFAFMLRVLCYFFGLNLAHKNLALLGNFCLALFLALALISIDLKALLDIGLPLFVLLCLELVLMLFFVFFITFRVFGRDYEAALLSSAQCGLCLGATPIALANLEKLELRFFSSKSALAILCLSGVFFIDFINLLVIWLFLSFL
ncbi:MAG: sodium/glutamate symporter [Campylobacter sp.]|uniref:sodium/glutamate symporter n=1 Tax=Campylobacter sp. TaxID=205 RepID=UPI002A909F29|nr:sodium/glutamate symporter [Campylobacter sp.]MDY6187652.1 sodium/glutamate symporter [Campylobacter sp.]